MNAVKSTRGLTFPFQSPSRLLWMLTAATLLLTGCGHPGPERTSAEGQVTFDGKPLESGSIIFIPMDQTAGPSAGGSIENGKYQILAPQGPIVGSHQVQIRAFRKSGRMTPAGPQPGAAPSPEMEMFIPEKYNSKSTLEVVFDSGMNQNDFELKSE